jgi:Fe-S cluster assembly ATP-binding protein
MLTLFHLTSTVGQKTVVDDLDLKIKSGTTHALMGPNGAGKSSLAYTLMGHPAYKVDHLSSVKLDNLEILPLSPQDRAKAGLFLAFQSPVAIDGVSVQNFLKVAYEAVHCADCADLNQNCPRLSVSQFRILLKSTAASLNLAPEFLTRSVNDGFSGGERKRLEMLQLLILKPKYTILDETDSGLDVDSLKLVAKTINHVVAHDHTGVLLITHYPRLLEYVKPTTVSIMVDGHIVKSGDVSLVDQIETNGYEPFSRNV